MKRWRQLVEPIEHLPQHIPYINRLKRQARNITTLILILVVFVLAIVATIPLRDRFFAKQFENHTTQAASSISFDNYQFKIVEQYVGQPDFYTWSDVQDMGAKGIAQGFVNWGTTSSSLSSWLQGNSYDYMLFLPGNATARDAFGSYNTGVDIDTQVANLKQMTTLMGDRIWWDGLGEWDSSGGQWSFGLPRRLPDRDSFYNAIKNYYTVTLQPIGNYWTMGRTNRGVNLSAGTDFDKDAHYALEWGADCAISERINDDLGDIQTAISWFRGAARQYDKCWGVDYSTWRDAGNGPTEFDSTGKLTNGWSVSYFKRHYYAAYMNNAHYAYMEPTVWYTSGTTLNPLGQELQKFANFAKVRHPDVGKTVVPLALVLSHNNGFEPKWKYWNQTNTVWYGDLPYNDGDYMVDNFLQVAYPGFQHSGEIPNAPWGEPSPSNNYTYNTQGYINFLAGGGDPRPYEPLAPSRWGESFDVILNNATATTLSKYKILMLGGNVIVDDTLRTQLQAFLQSGGTLIANTKQVTPNDQSYLGVKVGTTEKTSSSSTWIPDGTSYAEQNYTYTIIAPTTASVVAKNSEGDPLVTKNSVGAGTVYLTTPDYLQSSAKDSLLHISTKLLDSLMYPNLPIQISGPQIMYTEDQGTDKTVVMLSNNTGSTWTGTLTFPKPSGGFQTAEWTSDTAVPNTTGTNTVSVSASIPPYDVKVYAITYAANSTPPTSTPTTVAQQTMTPTQSTPTPLVPTNTSSPTAIPTATAAPTPSPSIFTLSNVTATNIQRYQTTIKWVTNLPGTTLVEYWRSGSTTHYWSANNTSLTNSHSMTLGKLARRTTYYYIAHSQDASGVDHVSSTQSFRTKN